MPRPPDCSLRASRFRLIRACPAPGRSPSAGCCRRWTHPGTAREGGSGSLRSHQAGRVPRPRTGVLGVGDARSARTRPGSRCPDDTDHGGVAASRLARTSYYGGCVGHARAGGRWIERAPLEVLGLASLPEPFCHGLRCEKFIFAGGQSALDEDGKVVGAGNRADQTELVMRYVAQVLGAAGACFDDVLKLNTYYCHSVGAGALQGGADAQPPGGRQCFAGNRPGLVTRASALMTDAFRCPATCRRTRAQGLSRWLSRRPSRRARRRQDASRAGSAPDALGC